jgi:hypothetical protein
MMSSASQFFPPVSESEDDNTVPSPAETSEKSKDSVEAEAMAVAEKLPDPPTTEPNDSEHVGKKRKHETSS